jgi:hypothetical protein
VTTDSPASACFVAHRDAEAIALLAQQGADFASQSLRDVFALAIPGT